MFLFHHSLLLLPASVSSGAATAFWSSRRVAQCRRTMGGRRRIFSSRINGYLGWDQIGCPIIGIVWDGIFHNGIIFGIVCDWDSLWYQYLGHYLGLGIGMVEDSHGLKVLDWDFSAADVQNQSFFQVVSWRKWSNRKKWRWTLNATTRWRFPLQGLMWMLRDVDVFSTKFEDDKQGNITIK